MSDKRLTRRALLTLRTGRPATAEDPCAPAADPFASYDFACAQVNEARPFLADEARRLGIRTENRSDLDILKDVFAKAHPPAD